MPPRDDVRIPSGGEQLAAYVYRPEDAGADVPCVVMAHGFTATRDDALPGYAEAFAEAGFAAVVFDYRNFGASSGQPRQLLNVAKQHDDYRAVIAYTRALEGVDADRIVLWGSSFSGGHVLAVAATDPRIAAVVAQAPYTDGIPTLLNVPPRNILRATAEGISDQLGALAGRPPRLVPAVADPGGFAAMSDAEAKPGFEAIVPPESKWRNEFAARLMLTMALYRPGLKAAKLRMPLLIAVCDGDHTTPPKPAIRAAERAPKGELKRYPYGHFAIYHDPRAKADQVEFLTRATAPAPVVVA